MSAPSTDPGQDREGAALAACYALARARARQLRAAQNETPIAVTFAGTPATGADLSNTPKDATHADQA
jgi:hypothetical protein